MLPSVKTTTSAPGLIQAFAAQWPAYVLPYRRFVVTLASANARLGADADRYSFTVADFHHLLLAGLTGAPFFLIIPSKRGLVDSKPMATVLNPAAFSSPSTCGVTNSDRNWQK